MRSIVFFLIVLLVPVVVNSATEWEMFTKDFYYDTSKIERLGEKVSVQVKIDSSKGYKSKYETGPSIDHLVVSMVINCKEMTYKKLSTTSFDVNGKVISPDFGNGGKEMELFGSPYVDLGKILCVQQTGNAKTVNKKK